MSISLITSGPNGFDLYGNTVTANEVNATSLVAGSVDTTEVTLSSLGAFNASNADVGFSLTLKYTVNGVCNLYYDGRTGSSTIAITDPSYFQLGSLPGSYNITTLPIPRGSDGIKTYGYVTLANSGETAFYQGRLELEKVSSTVVRIKIYTTGTTFPSGFRLLAFNFSYPVV